MRTQHLSFKLSRWLIVWLALYGAGLLLYNVSYAYTRNVLIHHLQVRPAAAILSATLPGHGISCEGETIYSKRLTLLKIKRGCDGMEAWLVMATALIAFPMSWKRRLRSVLYGTLLIYTLNLFRIVSIYHLMLHRPDLFDFVHGFIWQGIMILSAVVFVLIWLDVDKPEARS